ncbi:hypothetical protein ruthe_01414 [Rubellimicrobium thermophilum DSM 16684]|uniref:Plant Basic Secretory Protein n=2 Tax=Rubellimicrobium TaxID=295418 RepID=S9R3X9_9RHOB|nr:hypothetical protein ruthe_01414 [Rubellimicrobium thermophilum DSM 16684]
MIPRPGRSCLALIVAMTLLAACGRPLAPGERAFLATLHGDTILADNVRLHDGLAIVAPREVPAPPRTTCQARIYPPPDGPTIRVHTGALALFEDVHVRRDLYREDMAAGWPDVIPLAEAMLLAHEMVHVWQWQNRELTGYHPLRAAFEHAGSPDPYLFDLATSTDFLDYGYEQQGSIMEEYVCCRTLAPDAPRTARLHALLAKYFPLAPLDAPGPRAAILPWSGVEIEGICD